MAEAHPRSIEYMLVGYLTGHVSAPVSVDPEQSFDPPMVMVERVGGTHDGYRLDRAVVDIDAFAGNRLGAEALAWECDVALLALAGTEQRELVITAVRVEAAPRHVAYGNNNMRRFSATYELFTHAA